MVVESRLSVCEALCHSVVASLEKSGFAKEDLFAVHLALEEAFVNAVRHGNEMDPAKHVKVDYCIDDEKVEITISDQGHGFDPEAVPDPRKGQNLLKPNGRGLLLIRSYMDIVEHNEQGNVIRMVRYKQRSGLSQQARQEKGR